MNHASPLSPPPTPTALPAVAAPPQSARTPPRFVPPTLTKHGTVAGLTQDFSGGFDPEDLVDLGA